MRIKNKKTGAESIVTEQGYADIVAQGWQGKFIVLNQTEEVANPVEVVAIPKSISADLKEKSIDFALPDVESKLVMMPNNEARESFVLGDPRSNKINKLMKKFRNNNN